MKKLGSIFILLFVFATTITIYSCNCKEACTASDWQYALNFKGFSKNELAIPILKSYVKGSGFTQILDSILLTELTTTVNITSNDTSYRVLLMANDNADYKLIVNTPSSGTYYYYLTEMMFPIGTCKSCTKTYQIHTLKSWLLNGVSFSNDLGNNVIVIQK